jgi:hypothetical protein
LPSFFSWTSGSTIYASVSAFSSGASSQEVAKSSMKNQFSKGNRNDDQDATGYFHLRLTVTL